MNLLSNAPPIGHGHQIQADLTALDLTTTLLQYQQQFPLKVIQTSCQTKLVETSKVSPHNLILFIRWVWKYNKYLITTPVLESLVYTICSQSHLKPGKNDIYFLWDLLKNIGHYQTRLLNARILNQLIEFLSIMGREGKVALDVFNKFEAFQCVPNPDTYYFTLQALLTTSSSADMVEQAASICQKLMLLSHDNPCSSQDYNHLPLSLDEDDNVTASKDFQTVLQLLIDTPPVHSFVGMTHKRLSYLNLTTRQILKIIEISSQNALIETPKVSSHNLIHFIKWLWRRRNSNKSLYKDLVTAPVLESLVSAIWDHPPRYLIQLRKNDMLFLWDLLKHIGHCQTGLLNAQILNQLIDFFGFIGDNGKAALEVFHKFEVFQCDPNQDTYTFTLDALPFSCCNDTLQQAASICRKMLLHPETLLPDDGRIIGNMLWWFSQNNMIKEAYALYLAAKEKHKRNPKWSLDLTMLLPPDMIRILCSKKETVHLALEMLINMPEEIEDWEEGTKDRFCCIVVTSLCRFKDFNAAKQLIFKMIAGGPLPLPSEFVFNIIINSCVKAGEVGQALEMVILMESIGLCTRDALTFRFSEGVLQIRKILEEAKRKDSKLIIALLYHTLIVGYSRLHNFDEVLKLLTQMKDFGVSCINVDEYHKLFHSLHLMAMGRKMERQQLEEMESIDRKMAEKQLAQMRDMDSYLAEEKLEEMYLSIRALF